MAIEPTRVPSAYLRSAAEHLVHTKHQAGQAHRSAAGSLIDYRLQEITGEAARGICTVPGNFVDKPAFASPWHAHDCELQIAVVLDGSVDLGYRRGTYARATKDDVLFIPGHTPHDVGAPSADYRIAEITFPGTFGTVEADMPDDGAPTPAVTLGTRDAVRAGTSHGLVEYRYPVASPYADSYALRRFVRSRTTPFVAQSLAHDDRYRMTVPVSGTREVDLGHGPVRLAVGDLLVVPGGAEAHDVSVSDDYAAVEVRLLRG